MSESENPIEALEASLGATPGSIGPQPRRRGRPRKDNSLPPDPMQQGTPQRRRRSRGSEIRQQITQGIQVLDAIMIQVAPKYVPYQLQAQEIDALGEAIAVEVDANDKLQKLAAKAGSLTPHIALLTVCASIALPRIGMYLQYKNQGVQPPPPMQTQNGVHPDPVSNDIIDPLAAPPVTEEPKPATAWGGWAG